MSSDLTDDERDELVSLSRATVASDRYPLSPRIRRAQGRAGEARPSAAGSRTVTAAEALSSAECVAVKKAAAIRVRGEEVIAEIDIWRAANLLMSHHGADAEIEAAKKADLMLERGDHEGQGVWMRIRRAIVELQAPQRGPAH